MKLAVACLSVLLLSACASAPPPVAAPPTTSTTTAAPTSSPAPSPTTSRKRSPRGNLMKSVGELAAWGENDELAAEFTLTAIEVDPPCKAKWSKTDGKHMLLLSFTVRTTEKLPTDDSWSIVPNDFEVVGPDGLTESELFPEGYGNCPKDQLPFRPYSPASKLAGTVVLFSKHAHGTLVYRPSSNTGWEWTY
ncbi:hypothetical protein [Crossiella sp. CA198]|uniref:hypothetical protein n=1 Tax=Crossiella sp. CA198 TaxID=3455607 RepID=UPI003F8D6723